MTPSSEPAVWSPRMSRRVPSLQAVRPELFGSGPHRASPCLVAPRVDRGIHPQHGGGLLPRGERLEDALTTRPSEALSERGIAHEARERVCQLGWPIGSHQQSITAVVNDLRNATS